MTGVSTPGVNRTQRKELNIQTLPPSSTVSFAPRSRVKLYKMALQYEVCLMSRVTRTVAPGLPHHVTQPGSLGADGVYTDGAVKPAFSTSSAIRCG